MDADPQIRGARGSGASIRGSGAGSTACAASAEQVSAAHRPAPRTQNEGMDRVPHDVSAADSFCANGAGGDEAGSSA